MKATAVRFNEGPDYRPNDDVQADYEVIFDDPTTDKEDKDRFRHTIIVKELNPASISSTIASAGPSTSKEPQPQQ